MNEEEIANKVVDVIEFHLQNKTLMTNRDALFIAINLAREGYVKLDDVLNILDNFETLSQCNICKREMFGIEEFKQEISKLNAPQTKPDRVKSDNSRRNVSDEKRENTIRKDKTVETLRGEEML